MIRLWQGGRRELVKLEPFAERKLFLDKEERGSLAEKRQNVSMVAFISDWPHAVWMARAIGAARSAGPGVGLSPMPCA